MNILLILGKETSDFARGEYNTGLFNAAIQTLSNMGHTISTTVVEEGYEPDTEIAKFKAADAVIFQYPVYWFMMPSSLKKYLDNVYAYGEFFGHGDGKYGSGGLMTGKKFMLSTTWNAPQHAFNDANEFFEGKSAQEALAPMRYTQKFCGMQELPHFSVHDVIHQPDFDNHKQQWLSHLQDNFS